MAYSVCKFKGRSCGFCGGDDETVLYCGIAHGETRISEMKGCPQIKVEKKTKVKKGGK